MKLLPGAPGRASPPPQPRRRTVRDRRRSREPRARQHITTVATRAGEGIEWEDDMVEVNRMTTPANMRWLLSTGPPARRTRIDWRFRVGDQVKIRLVNEMDSDHPMHHPFHVHGAGRFLILSRDGPSSRTWCGRDTVLVRRGETVDILLDVTNPGVWMAHCHIRRTPRERHDVQLPRRPRDRFGGRKRDALIR